MQAFGEQQADEDYQKVLELSRVENDTSYMEEDPLHYYSNQEYEQVTKQRPQNNNSSDEEPLPAVSITPRHLRKTKQRHPSSSGYFRRKFSTNPSHYFPSFSQKKSVQNAANGGDVSSDHSYTGLSSVRSNGGTHTTVDDIESSTHTTDDIESSTHTTDDIEKYAASKVDDYDEVDSMHFESKPLNIPDSPINLTTDKKSVITQIKPECSKSDLKCEIISNVALKTEFSSPSPQSTRVGVYDESSDSDMTASDVSIIRRAVHNNKDTHTVTSHNAHLLGSSNPDLKSESSDNPSHNLTSEEVLLDNKEILKQEAKKQLSSDTFKFSGSSSEKRHKVETIVSESVKPSQSAESKFDEAWTTVLSDCDNEDNVKRSGDLPCRNYSRSRHKDHSSGRILGGKSHARRRSRPKENIYSSDSECNDDISNGVRKEMKKSRKSLDKTFDLSAPDQQQMYDSLLCEDEDGELQYGFSDVSLLHELRGCEFFRSCQFKLIVFFFWFFV